MSGKRKEPPLRKLTIEHAGDAPMDIKMSNEGLLKIGDEWMDVDILEIQHDGKMCVRLNFQTLRKFFRNIWKY